MQPVQLCIHCGRQFEETLKKTQWGAIDEAGAFHRLHYTHLNILLGVIDGLANQRGAGDVIASVRESSQLLGNI